MGHAAIRHVADVQQAVDAAQVDERAVFGEVFDGAGDNRAFFEQLQRGALARVLLFLDRHLARHHHIAAAPVQLDDLDRDVLAHERIQIVDGPHVDLRARHERGHADVHHEPALGAPGDAAGNDQPVAMRLLQLVPGAQAAGLLMREQHVAFGLRRPGDPPSHRWCRRLERECCRRAAELLDRNQAFGLVSEVDDDFGVVKFYDTALQQLAFVRRREMTVVFDELLVIRLFGYGRI